MEIINWLEVEPNVYSSGQPQPDFWPQVAQAGVKTVVNLRPDTEQDADEKPLVEANDMAYVHIPIGGLNDFSDDAIGKLNELLETEQEGLLVHCASGNRVGALFALAAASKGSSIEDAMERGRRAGLTKLAPQVEQLLQQNG